MIVICVDHEIRDGMIDAARERIGRNSAEMAQCKGLISRKTGIVSGTTNHIVTVTEWASREDKEAWEQRKKSVPVSVDPSTIYASATKTEFEVYESLP